MAEHYACSIDKFTLGKSVSIGYTSRMMKKDVGMRIRIERELRDEFLAACQVQDRPAAQVIREFMRTYVEAIDTASQQKNEMNRQQNV